MRAESSRLARFTAPTASDRAWSRGPNPRGGTVPSTPPVDRGAHAVVANSLCTYRGSTTPDRSPTDRAVRARPRHTTRSGHQGVFLDHRPWAAVHDCLASAARLQRARTLSTVIANSKPAGRRHGSRMAVAMRYCGDGIPSGMSASPFVDCWVPSRTTTHTSQTHARTTRAHAAAAAMTTKTPLKK